MEPVFTRRSTWTFAVIAFIAFTLLLTLYLVKQKQEIRQRAAPVINLDITPATNTVNQGSEFNLDVVIDTQSAANKVQSIDLTVVYDTSFLDGISITNGSFLPNITSSSIIENGVARIGLAANSLDPRSGQGTVATLKFRARNPVTKTSVSIDQSTFITTVGSTDNSLGSTAPSDIQISRTIFPDTTLYLTADVNPVLINQEFYVNIMMNTNSNQISVATVNVNYDQNDLQGLQVIEKDSSYGATADFLPNILVPGTIGNGTASIQRGSPLSGSVQGAGLLAKLKFKSLRVGSSALTINQSSTARVNRTEENMVSNRQGLTIGINNITVTPVPTPTPTPSATPSTNQPNPTPTPTPAGGWTCSKSSPAAPSLSGSSNSTSKINLKWNSVANATYYGIVYGFQPGKYVYGAANVGNVTAYTVSGLASGTTYYFAVFAVNDCAPSSYSNAVSVKTLSAGTGGTAYKYPSPTPVKSVQLPSPTPVFVPIPANTDAIPFLAAKPRMLPSPFASVTPASAPKLNLPTGFGETKPGQNPLFTPLGGILLIIILVFLIIFFIRMRQ